MKEEKQGMEQLLEIKKSTKLISKTNFCEVLVKVVPQAIPGQAPCSHHCTDTTRLSHLHAWNVA